MARIDVPAINATAPARDMEVLTDTGARVRLADFHGDGPALLLFYRGWW